MKLSKSITFFADCETGFCKIWRFIITKANRLNITKHITTVIVFTMVLYPASECFSPEPYPFPPLPLPYWLHPRPSRFYPTRQPWQCRRDSTALHTIHLRKICFRNSNVESRVEEIFNLLLARTIHVSRCFLPDAILAFDSDFCRSAISDKLEMVVGKRHKIIQSWARATAILLNGVWSVWSECVRLEPSELISFQTK